MTNEDVIDIIVITALPLEHEAVVQGITNPTEQADNGVRYVRGSIADYSVVAFPMAGMGNARSAAFVSKAISHWSPKYVVIVGIAGGIEKANERLLGDVLVGEQILAYEPGKLTPEGQERRYQVYRSASELVRESKFLSADKWALSITTVRPDGTSGRVIPKAHIGVIGSGEKVITSPDFVSDLKTQWPELIGIEMEGYGLALAAHEFDNPPKILLVKGISDWANPEKNDGWQKYAAEASARFAVALFKSMAELNKRHSKVSSSENLISGRVKLMVCRRLGKSWGDLADFLEIPEYDRARFEQGREAASVWLWLEERRRLDELPESLRMIGREDLAKELTSNPQ